jgi:hypothetical protein
MYKDTQAAYTHTFAVMRRGRGQVSSPRQVDKQTADDDAPLHTALKVQGAADPAGILHPVQG